MGIVGRILDFQTEYLITMHANFYSLDVEYSVHHDFKGGQNLCLSPLATYLLSDLTILH
jgi:hypothetical protein